MVTLLIVVVVSALIITGGVIAFYVATLNSTPVQTSDKKCNVLYDNGGSINVVFISDEGNAKRYTDFLISVNPMAKNKDSFNFFYVESDIADKECEIYKGIALLCYSKNVVKEASICPNDYIVVLKDMPKSIRSSSFANVMSLNTEHSLTVFAHEFGHAFANFAEEYMTEAKVPKGSRNCQQECTGFGGIEEGCFEGCTNNQYSRSIDNGVMRTLSTSKFGTFNEYVIKGRIDEENIKKSGNSITGKVTTDQLRMLEGIGDCNKQLAYYVVDYDGNKAEITNYEVSPGCLGSNGYGLTEVTILSENGEELTSNINDILFTDDADKEMGEDLSGETFDNKVQPDEERIPLVIKNPVDRDKIDIATLLLRTPIDIRDYNPDEISTEVKPDEEDIQKEGYITVKIELPQPDRSNIPVNRRLPSVSKYYEIVRDSLAKVANIDVANQQPGDTEIIPDDGINLQPSDAPEEIPTIQKNYDCGDIRIVDIQESVSETDTIVGINEIKTSLNNQEFVVGDCVRDGNPVVVVREINLNDGYVDGQNLEDYLNEPVTENTIIIEFVGGDVEQFDEVFIGSSDVPVILAVDSSVANKVASAISLMEDQGITPTYEDNGVDFDYSQFASGISAVFFGAKFATGLTGLSIYDSASSNEILKRIYLIWAGVAVGLVLVIAIFKDKFLKKKKSRKAI